MNNFPAMTEERLQELIEELQEVIKVEIHSVYGYAARIALAALTAKPVFQVEISGNHWLNAGPVDDPDFTGMPDGINNLYPAPPAPVLRVPEWTNEQCLEFLSIAFRHAEISGDIEMDDIRMGIKMVNSAAPEVE